MSAEGVEPSIPFGYGSLNPVRIPIPPCRLLVHLELSCPCGHCHLKAACIPFPPQMHMIEIVGFEPRFLIPNQVCYHYTTISNKWGEKDSNLRCFFVTDLQSAPIASTVTAPF